MANVNDKWSSGVVTPSQRGSFDPLTADGGWAAPWGAGRPATVENAHDLQAAPNRAYSGTLNNNIVNAPASPPVVDRAAEERR